MDIARALSPTQRNYLDWWKEKACRPRIGLIVVGWLITELFRESDTSKPLRGKRLPSLTMAPSCTAVAVSHCDYLHLFQFL